MKHEYPQSHFLSTLKSRQSFPENPSFGRVDGATHADQGFPGMKMPEKIAFFLKRPLRENGISLAIRPHYP